MKRFVLMALVVSCALTFLNTPLLAAKAGEVKDGVYTDKDYQFSFTVPTGWSENVKKAKAPLRIVMDQKSYPIPRQFQGEGKEDYAQIPIITVLADTCSATVDTFLAQLLDNDYKTAQMKFFRKHLRLIAKPYDILKQKEFTFENAKAIQLEGRQQYTMEVAARGSDKADVVTDYLGGSIFITVRDGEVLLFHIINEYAYNADYLNLFNHTLGTLKFDMEEAAKKE